MKQHKIFYGSSYDRGLDNLLFLWGDIKDAFPDAELHCCYGWDLFDKATQGNPERQQWKQNVQELMNQPGIIHHGRIGQDELKKVRKECGIWAYPTYFDEINCITALEVQSDGLVPVVINRAALDETVGSGVKVEGSIRNPKVLEEFKNQLLRVMGDYDYWLAESKKAKAFAKKYAWKKMADKWISEFKKPIYMPHVTIVTPTIRSGFWNFMANNIATQTYLKKGGTLDWLVVDDHKDDRSQVAKKYADKYGIEINYLRGEAQKTKRKYGLSNANNTAMRNAKGDLLVWLQDFILMPEYGIEMLVDIHRKNPEALIAPTDVYYSSKYEPLIGQDDWFDGKLDIVGKFIWKNIRNKYEGIRESENPYEFEMNYAAIPAKVVKKLNGWWEFLGDALGFDNVEIAYRAILSGSKIIVDDTNVAICIDHWEPLGGTDENGKDREHNLNDPRYEWMLRRMKEGKLPIVRDQEIDDSISLTYEIPKETSKQGAVDWVYDHLEEIISKWPTDV